MKGLGLDKGTVGSGIAGPVKELTKIATLPRPSGWACLEAGQVGGYADADSRGWAGYSSQDDTVDLPTSVLNIA
jgi:hypothetical protein